MSRLFGRNSVEISAIVFFATAAFFITIEDYMVGVFLSILELIGDFFDIESGIYIWLKSLRVSLYSDGLGVVMLVLSVVLTFWIVRKLAR